MFYIFKVYNESLFPSNNYSIFYSIVNVISFYDISKFLIYECVCKQGINIKKDSSVSLQFLKFKANN